MESPKAPVRATRSERSKAHLSARTKAPAMEPIDKNPQAHGAVVFKWPDEEDDHGGERAGMAAFLGGGGGAKKRKLDRHKLLTESKLEPVTTWA